jgi:hypothetical protein
MLVNENHRQILPRRKSAREVVVAMRSIVINRSDKNNTYYKPSLEGSIIRTVRDVYASQF